jgi:hypothetical protein
MCAALLVLSSLSASAGGLGCGFSLYTMDVTGTFDKVPVALDSALDALESTFDDLGASTAELDDLRAQFREVTDEWGDLFGEYPMWIPIPLVGGSIDVGLPFVVVDGVRVSGGFLSDDLLRGIGLLSGLAIPDPLIDLELEAGTESATLTADFGFSTFMASSDLTKRFGLVFAAVELGAGVYLIRGSIDPTVTVGGTSDLSAGVQTAVDALHLDGLTWSEFGAHVLAGIELGPPFFRLHADLRYTFPVSQTIGWWEIGIGRLAAVLGMVIRF